VNILALAHRTLAVRQHESGSRKGKNKEVRDVRPLGALLIPDRKDVAVGVEFHRAVSVVVQIVFHVD
jgi:hypothetical protein